MGFLHQLLCLCFSAATAVAGTGDWRAEERFAQDQAGIFFEPSPTLSETEIREAFRFACHWNKEAPAAMRLPQLVVQYTGYWDPKRQRAVYYDRELKIAAEYFSCFERVFLGSAHVDSADGVDAQLRFLLSGKLAAAHRKAARQLLEGIGAYVDITQEKFHWFLPVEFQLDQLVRPAMRRRDQDLIRHALSELLDAIADEFQVRENERLAGKRKRILWAPHIGKSFAALSSEKSRDGESLREQLVAKLHGLLIDNPAISDVTLLDGAGRSSAFLCDQGSFCYRLADQPEPLQCDTDTVPYFQLMKDAAADSRVVRVGIGLELQYGKIQRELSPKGWGPAPGYLPMPFPEMERRMRCLARNEIPAAPSYELRFFHRAFSAKEKSYRYQYFDVPFGHPHFEAIAKLEERGIAWPCRPSGNRFCPADPVARKDASVFLHRAERGVWLNPEGEKQPVFSDVEKDEPLRGFIEDASAKGWVQGCGGKKFCPAELLTRRELVLWILKARKEKPAERGVIPFSDVPTDDAFAPWLARAQALGFAVPCNETGDQFCPDRPVTRGELAEILSKAYKY